MSKTKKSKKHGFLGFVKNLFVSKSTKKHKTEQSDFSYVRFEDEDIAPDDKGAPLQEKLTEASHSKTTDENPELSRQDKHAKNGETSHSKQTDEKTESWQEKHAKNGEASHSKKTGEKTDLSWQEKQEQQSNEKTQITRL